MKAEQDIIAALRALAGADSAVEASPELEARVRQAFRARQARRKWNRAATWMLAAAAVLIAVLLIRQPHPRPAVVARDPAPAAVADESTTIPVHIAAPVKQRHARSRPPREIVTEFFPLIDAPPPMDRGEVFRVSVTAAAMRTVGLPVAEDRLSDRVQADVLVSEEGLATAIRFVKQE